MKLSLFTLVVIGPLLPIHPTYTMLSTSLGTCPAVSNCSFSPAQEQKTQCLADSRSAQVSSASLTIPHINALPADVRASIIRDDILKAVDQGDTETVVAGFSGWMNWVMPSEYYRASVAYTLLHAAGKSPKVTGSIVNELLTRVKASDIIEPDKLIFRAMDNNHIDILKHMQKVDPQRMAAMLAIEIIGGNHNRVTALLKAGVQPINNPGLKLPYVLLQVACDAFLLENTKVRPTARVQVLNAMLSKIGSLPADHYVDISKLPAGLQETVAKTLQSKLAPSQAPLIEVTETPLHVAARNKDYNACFALLTAFQGPMVKANYFPNDAMDVMGNSNYNGQETQEMVAASRKMSQYMVQMKKLMDARSEIARKIRLEKNKNGLTAQEVAIAAKAPKELVDLLDPENSMSLADRLMNNIAAQAKDAAILSYVPHHVFNQKTGAQLNKEGLSLGHTIIVNGQKYVVVSKKKVT